MTLTEQRERKIEELDDRIKDLRKHKTKLRESLQVIEETWDLITDQIDGLCKDRDYLINKKGS